MKKLLLTMLVVLSTIAIYAEGFSVAPFAGIATFDYSPIDDGTAYGVSLNYSFTPIWGIEALYAKSKFDYEYLTASSDLEVTSIALYLTANYDLNANFYFKGKAGISKNEGDVDISASSWSSYYGRYLSFSTSFEVEETEFTCGAGLGYKINDTFSIEGEVNMQGEDYFTYGVRANWKIS